MSETSSPTSEATAPPSSDDGRSVDVAVAVAALASLGAGAVHAAAIGVHNDVRPTAITFTILAVAQIGWAAAALARPRARAVLLSGLLVHGGAVVGWALAKSVGIGFVDGLDTSESIQLADGIAAGLAATAGALTAWALLVPASAGAGLTAAASRAAQRPGFRLMGLAVPVAALTVAAMVTTGSHSHAGGAGHSHGGEEAAADHAHGEGDEHADGDAHAAGEEHADGEHGPAAVVPPTEYDPNLPINLSGVAGVSLEEQARAENLIAITLARLPQFADTATAEAKGFKSIGDGFTGHEHYINWDYLSDGRTLDPDYPESLVYDTTGPEKRLVSAMFMTEPGVTLETVPNVGGKLTQWHIHDDLCFTQGDAPRVVGITEVGGTCEAPLQKFNPVPMIHVWIESHPCGPFAALEGVGAGQIKEGEERLCDHAHGGGEEEQARTVEDREFTRRRDTDATTTTVAG